ncbi:MAG: sugar diacid recognition domain-containing protein [Pseudomonadota bacterium]
MTETAPSGEKRLSIDVEYAQTTCDFFAKQIGQGVLVIDHDGTIVASSARERIGDHHENGARIMRGELDEYENTEAMARTSRECGLVRASPSILKARDMVCWQSRVRHLTQ